MALINPVPATNVEAVIGNGWQAFFQSVYTICFALTQSGTTANRPTKLLWVGRTYFDTSLGIPIWYKGPGWVNASGGAV